MHGDPVCALAVKHAAASYASVAALLRHEWEAAVLVPSETPEQASAGVCVSLCECVTRRRGDPDG